MPVILKTQKSFQKLSPWSNFMFPNEISQSAEVKAPKFQVKYNLVKRDSQREPVASVFEPTNYVPLVVQQFQVKAEPQVKAETQLKIETDLPLSSTSSSSFYSPLSSTSQISPIPDEIQQILNSTATFKPPAEWIPPHLRPANFQPPAEWLNPNLRR